MITQNQLKKTLSYDKNTGIFIWKNIGENKIAGNVEKEKGYVRIKINGKNYYAHRLAWLYIYGEMPVVQIDHINHNRIDNRIENLRIATNKVNLKNQSKRKTNTSGANGITWCKRAKKWYATISIDGKRKSLGYHIKFSEAVDARKDAEVLYGYHKNHGKEK